MAGVKHHYALNEQGRLVSIKQAYLERNDSHTYHCLGCGAGMIARLGEVRTWHFAHRADEAHCGTETYLHKLAKRLIKEKFEKDPSFLVGYYRDVKCLDMGTCPFAKDEECHIPKLETFDLKEFYDTCQEEVFIDGFRPDLRLTCSSKPDREPVFIEIFKAHQSDEPKIDSNYRIIETKRIDSEKDIDDIVEKGFIEGENCTTYNFHPKLPSIRKKDVPIDRFVLFKNGAAKVYKAIDYEVYCAKINEKVHSNSLVELNMVGQGVDIWADNVIEKSLDSYQTGLVYLVKKGMNIRNCILCKFYKYNDY